MPEKKSKRRRLRLSFIGGRRPSLLPPPPKRSKNKDKENKTTDVGDDKKVVEPDLECMVVNENVILEKEVENIDVLTSENEISINKPENLVINKTIVLEDKRKDIVNNELEDMVTSENEVQENKTETEQDKLKDVVSNEVEETGASEKEAQEIKKEIEVMKIKKKLIEEELIKWKSSLQSNIIVDAEYSKVYDERCPSFNLEQEMSDLYDLRHDWEMDVEEYNEKIKELVVTKELVAKRLEKQCVELKSIAQDHNKNDLATPRHLIKKILNPT